MKKTNPRIITELLDGQGYGQRIATGLNRFRTKRPDWVFVRCASGHLPHMRPGSFIGAIGHYSNKRQLADLKRNKVPFYVSVSGTGQPEWWPRVIPDSRAVGRVAAEYFLKKGYHHFAIAGLGGERFAVNRAAGFLDRLKADGIRHVDTLDRATLDRYHPESGALPLAVFAVTDSKAESVMNWFAHAGLSIPEEVAILGVDDDPTVAPYVSVPLSSIELPLEKIGFDACELLEEMVASGRQDYGTYRHAPIGVVERRSTGSIAVMDNRIRRAQAYMADHLAEVDNLEAVATAIKTSKRTLVRLFSRHLGATPSEWLMRRRVEHAEKLLLETDYTIDHVASLAGLEERRRLYRSFRKLGRPLPSVIRASAGR